MTASNYTVNGGSPTEVIVAPLQWDAFLYNSDPNNTIYLDDQSGMTASSGFPLGPLASKIWLAGSQCFAIADAGKTAVLNISKNAGDLWNPGAIAGQILQQGLASQIASDINTQGVPPIDRPTILYHATITAPALNAPQPSPLIDCTQFPGLYMKFAEVGATVEISREINLVWYADAAGIIQIANDMVFLDTLGGDISGAIPRRGPYLQIGYAAANNATDDQLTSIVVGTYSQFSAERWFVNPVSQSAAPNLSRFSYAQSGYVQWNNTSVPVSTLTDIFPFFAGRHMLYCLANNNSTFLIRDEKTGKEVVRMSLSANVPQVVEVGLAASMCRAEWSNTAAGGVFIGNLAYKGSRT